MEISATFLLELLFVLLRLLLLLWLLLRLRLQIQLRPKIRLRPQLLTSLMKILLWINCALNGTQPATTSRAP
jgi:hypothetical protein